MLVAFREKSEQRFNERLASYRLSFKSDMSQGSPGARFLPCTGNDGDLAAPASPARVPSIARRIHTRSQGPIVDSEP